MKPKLILTLCGSAVLIALAVLLLSRHAGSSGSGNPGTPAQRAERSAMQLRSLRSRIETEAALASLRSTLRKMKPHEASTWIVEQLDGGEDFALPMPMTLDARQELDSWPSWRVFLLDRLFAMDRDAAASYSRRLLDRSNSADEWAICMRNLAHHKSDLDLLRKKSTELLRRIEWQHNPSAGYLEAFDVIVHTKNTAVTEELLVHCDNREAKALRHAAFLTLDRLTLAAPEKVLPLLAASAARHSPSGPMISNMMARADIRQSIQRTALETYLLDPKRNAEELQGFASIFPNANLAFSNNLLTTSRPLPRQDIAARDRASWEQIERWLEDPRFNAIRGTLLECQRRLAHFLSQP